MGKRSDFDIPRLHRRIDIRERLEAKAMYCGDCIAWIGYIGKDGYGKIGTGGKRKGISPTAMVHRVAYELYKSEIPEDMEVDHLCRNRAYINPAHLEAVPKAENIRRAFMHKITSTHCRNGHLRTQQNTYVKRGWSECNDCRKQNSEVYHRKVK